MIKKTLAAGAPRYGGVLPAGKPLSRKIPMTWIKTPESSAIARFSYEDNRQILKVEFNHGSTYEYSDVPPVVFDQFRAAPSKGEFITQHIKGRYPYAKVPK